MTTTTYVLFNNCFGGFSFNHNFVLDLFKRFLPTTSEGSELFPETNFYKNQTETIPFFDDYHFIVEYDYDGSMYKEFNYIKNMKTNKFYFLQTHMTEHRANPNIIKFLFERADALSEEEFNSEYDKLISKTMFPSEREQIVSPDCSKKFTIHNWKNCDILVSHFLTIGISGSLSNLKIERVKPHLEWSVSEYDGSESIVVKFDYYNMISELVRELQINKINPSSECSEMISKLIRGEMTIDDLKTYESS
jgi:hypothetical protein